MPARSFFGTNSRLLLLAVVGVCATAADGKVDDTHLPGMAVQFCRTAESITEPPPNLHVTAGEFVFGTLSPTHACLAEAVRDNLTPRMETAEESYTDVKTSVTFFQRTFYRDTQLCARTQPFDKATPDHNVFLSAANGYCCYLSTESATKAKLKVLRGGSGALMQGVPLAEGSLFETSFGEDVLHTLRLQVSGEDITCGVSAGGADDIFSEPLDEISTTDGTFKSGGVAFMPYDVRECAVLFRVVVERWSF